MGAVSVGRGPATSRYLLLRVSVLQYAQAFLY